MKNKFHEPETLENIPSHCLYCPLGVFCFSRNPRPEFYFCPACGEPLGFRNLGRERGASMLTWLSGIPIEYCSCVRYVTGPCLFCRDAAARGEVHEKFVVPKKVIPDVRVPRGMLANQM